MNVELYGIQEMCIQRVENILKCNTALTEETIGTVRVMMDVALNIEKLNLHQQFQTRYGAAAFQGRSSARTAKEN